MKRKTFGLQVGTLDSIHGTQGITGVHTYTGGKSFCKTSFQLVDKYGNKAYRDENILEVTMAEKKVKKKTIPNICMYSRCRVVFLRVFIPALFLLTLQVLLCRNIPLVFVDFVRGGIKGLKPRN